MSREPFLLRVVENQTTGHCSSVDAGSGAGAAVAAERWLPTGWLGWLFASLSDKSLRLNNDSLSEFAEFALPFSARIFWAAFRRAWRRRRFGGASGALPAPSAISTIISAAVIIVVDVAEVHCGVVNLQCPPDVLGQRELP
ncbi:MAG: hypothetical protein GWP50_05065 [Proteobacteria bacterium]|nr:hypothetical protein [Pseudomonadota bacterium]